MKSLLVSAFLAGAHAQGIASIMSQVMPEKLARFEEMREAGQMPNRNAKSESYTPCVDGKAGEYPCQKIDLIASLTHFDMGGRDGNGNDLWGWTDDDGTEYALVGQSDGTAFVRIGKDGSLTYLGRMDCTDMCTILWRDMKVYQHYVYVVSEYDNDGLQVFDLHRLRDADPTDPSVFEPDYVYYDNGHTSSHNIVINEESGFAYSVGTKTYAGGLHFIDLSDPARPVSAGGYAEDGYTHDAQCVNYTGPDEDYIGREICACYNEDTLTFVDVTDKQNPLLISRTGYDGSHYTHQGWWTEDFKHILLDDELDELEGEGDYTATLLWDVQDLDNPLYLDTFRSPVKSIDHNLYIHKGLAYQSNYSAGLRITDVAEVSKGILKEVAYFDVHPEANVVEFIGTWSNYPYWASGYIGVNSIERGFYLVKVNL